MASSFTDRFTAWAKSRSGNDLVAFAITGECIEALLGKKHGLTVPQSDKKHPNVFLSERLVIADIGGYLAQQSQSIFENKGTKRAIKRVQVIDNQTSISMHKDFERLLMIAQSPFMEILKKNKDYQTFGEHTKQVFWANAFQKLDEQDAYELAFQISRLTPEKAEAILNSSMQVALKCKTLGEKRAEEALPLLENIFQNAFHPGEWKKIESAFKKLKDDPQYGNSATSLWEYGWQVNERSGKRNKGLPPSEREAEYKTAIMEILLDSIKDEPSTGDCLEAVQALINGRSLDSRDKGKHKETDHAKKSREGHTR